MKKLVVLALFSIIALGAKAQEDAVQAKVREASCEAANKAIESAEKNTNHAKRSLKSDTWIKLGDAYLDMATNCGSDSLAAVKAFETYQKALEVGKAEGKTEDASEKLVSENLNAALKSQGVAFYQNDNLGKAVELLEIANQVNSKDSTTALYAGIISQQNNDMETAKRNFENYVELGGKDVSVFYGLANMAKQEEDFDKALQYLEKGIMVNPDNKDLQAEKVNIYIATDRLDEAIDNLRKIVKADPENITNKLNLGILLDNGGKKEEALAIYKEVLEQDPNNFDCNYNVAVMYFNEAVEIKKEVDAMDIKTYQKEGKAIEEKVCAKFKQSKPYFEKCQSINPDDEFVNSNLTNLENVLSQCKIRNYFKR